MGVEALHQVLVPGPGRARGLLVQVHAHDERLAERAAELDQLGPGGMDAEDVAEDELAVRGAGLGDDGLGVLDRGGDRLFHEDMAAGIHRPQRVGGVGVGIGVDRDRVGAGLAQGRFEVVEDGVALERRRELLAAASDRAAHQAHDLEAVQLVIGERMALAHVADADDQDPDWIRHRTPPCRSGAVMARRGLAFKRRRGDRLS